jgi:hypothetical protein
MISQPEQNKIHGKLLTAIFDHSNYYLEKIASATFEPGINDTVLAKIGISSLLEKADRFQLALETRKLLDSHEEWQMDIDDLKYSLRNLESALSGQIQLTAVQQRLATYSICYLLDRISSLAKSLDREC